MGKYNHCLAHMHASTYCEHTDYIGDMSILSFIMILRTYDNHIMVVLQLWSYRFTLLVVRFIRLAEI